TRDHLSKYFARGDGVRPHGGDALLCTVEPSAGHHLHGPGDLLRRLDRRDALTNRFQVRHGSIVAPSILLRVISSVVGKAHLESGTNAAVKALSTSSTFFFRSSDITFLLR